MRKPARIDQEATEHLIRDVMPLLNPVAATVAASIYATHCRKGRANYRTGLVRVPVWVFRDRIHFCGKEWIDGGDQFAAYYLAHELAHIKARTDSHSPAFMAAFIELCPEHLRHYETIYKAARGIKRRDQYRASR